MSPPLQLMQAHTARCNDAVREQAAHAW